MRESGYDDYKKLERVKEDTQVIFGLPLVLSMDKSVKIKLYVYAAFAIHKDIRSHTGGFMTTGTGGDYVQSKNQKLNTKSSTEAKHILP